IEFLNEGVDYAFFVLFEERAQFRTASRPTAALVVVDVAAGLRGLTAASHSNLCSPCDRRQAVAWHAGSFAHYHRRVEFLAGLQHPEPRHQQLANGGDTN